MIENLYKNMNIYDDCRVDSIIYKKAFYENADITKREKDILKDNVEKILFKYSLKDENINTPSYKDEEIEYQEIEVIEVKITDEKQYKKVCELIQKSIPYPLIIVINKDNKVLINAAFKRINKNDEEKSTIEEFIYSDWINFEELSDVDRKFLQSINMKNLSFINMYKLYCSFVEKVNIFNTAKVIGDFSSIENKTKNEIDKFNKEITSIDNELNKLKAAITKEVQFNKSFDMNVRIKKLEIKRDRIIERLNKS